MPIRFDNYNNTTNSTSGFFSSVVPNWAYVAIPVLGAVMISAFIAYQFSKCFRPRRPVGLRPDPDQIHIVEPDEIDLDATDEENPEEPNQRDLPALQPLIFSDLRRGSFDSSFKSSIEEQLDIQDPHGLQTPRSMRSMSS